MLRDVNTIPWAELQTELPNTATHSLDVTEVTSGQPLEAEPDSRLCSFVAKAIKPVRKWNPPVLALVAK